MPLTFAPHVTVTETDGGIVLLDQQAGRYWQLNTTGSAVVRLLLDGGTAEQAITELRASHPQQADRVAADVDALLQSLREAQVVTS